MFIYTAARLLWQVLCNGTEFGHLLRFIEMSATLGRDGAESGVCSLSDCPLPDDGGRSVDLPGQNRSRQAGVDATERLL